MAPRQIDLDRRPRLTRVDIATAAVELVERDGLDALTMRRLAEALGCAPMSLYTHVSSRDDLVAAIIGLLIAQLEVDHRDGEDWQGLMRRAWTSYRDLAVRLPRSFELLASARNDLPVVADHLAAVVRSLERAGLEHDHARQILGITDAFASGFLLVWVRNRDDAAPADEFEVGAPGSIALFDRGLEAMIAGLAASL
ncbi:TetR/AcrR family transcriptional regulator [Microbacterium sp. NPDC058389]|uniref:TetR/AcrR family transcriptional regulator n=1 Tax=Microbacterium sp. NPDC058389 TaxID=3346475 RepID=UPI0036506412